MADVVTSQTLEDGNSRLVMKFTNESDGTGEANVQKVNAASGHGVTIAGQLYYPGVHLVVTDIFFSVAAMGLRIQWDATVPIDMLVLGSAATAMIDHWHFRYRGQGGFAGLINPLTTGATGNINFTTVGAAAGSSYNVILTMLKGIPQN